MCCSYEWQNGGWVLVTDSCSDAPCPNRPTGAPPIGVDGEMYLDGCPDGFVTTHRKKKPLVLKVAGRRITIRGSVHVGKLRATRRKTGVKKPGKA